MKIVEKIKLKIVIFTAVKNRCILHGRVFVMGIQFVDLCCYWLNLICELSNQWNHVKCMLAKTTETPTR